jgi:hypothetical protein
MRSCGVDALPIRGALTRSLKAWGLLEAGRTRLKLTQAGRDALRRLMAR